MKFYRVFNWLLAISLFFTACQSGSQSSSGNSGANVPNKVIEVLEVVNKTGKAPNGFVGGRTFQNREKRLPKEDAFGKKIKYQEWDVNKKVSGKNRGAERMVTGSDGSAYYTSDHYKTFTKIVYNKNETNPKEDTETEKGHAVSDSPPPTSSASIPNYVMETLAVITKTGSAPQGFVGGKNFQNREKLLPQNDANGQKISYKVWDVKASSNGKNRGSERLVTGSDGSAYFTNDFHKSFTKLNTK